MRNFLNVFIVIFAVAQLGCANFGKRMKNFLGGGTGETVAAAPVNSFNNNPNNMAAPKREYKRVTKQSLKEEANLEETAGSLWINEGQGAYLFSQNIMRMIGDPLKIQIDGEPELQLQSKADVIKKLVKKLEDRREQQARRLASEQKGEDGGENKKEALAPPNSQPATPGNPADSPEGKFAVRSVPTRITERMVDGNYRVKGSQTFMIGSREYKVIVTGIVRAEDFNEEGVSSNSLLDANFDIVASRGKKTDDSGMPL